jgi:hypothetical protein
VKQLYALLLHLFPRAYRQDYGDELQTVFNSSLDEARKAGSLEVLRVSLRELIGLPRAVIYEHLRERRKAKMIDRFGSYFDFSHGSWKELFIALFPFLLFGGLWPLIGVLVRLKVLPGPGPVATGIGLSLLGLFFIIFLVGVGKGLPRWSLPYLGFILALLSVYLFSGIIGILILLPFGNLIARMKFFGDLFYDGVLWLGLLIAIILLVVLTRFSTIFQRFRRDWTLPCFIVYGATPFALTLTFDEYTNDEPFMLLTLLVLGVGAWFYLRESSQRKRFWALFGALALSMFIAAAGKAILVPTQDWPFTLSTSLAISEAKHTIIMWAWLALGMLVPLAIKFVPRSDDLPPTTLSAG